MLDTRKAGRKTRTSHAQVVDELGRAMVAGTYPVGSILPGDAELALRPEIVKLSQKPNGGLAGIVTGVIYFGPVWRITVARTRPACSLNTRSAAS